MKISTLTAANLEALDTLQERYAQAYPGVISHPAGLYLSPGFSEGRSVFCMSDDNGCLAGFAPLYPTLAEIAGVRQHRVWVDIRVDPAVAYADAVRRLLLERLESATAELAQTGPKLPAWITFQYFPVEKEPIRFVQAHGYVHEESAFEMGRDLALIIPDPPLPDGLQVRPWRMESDAEQLQYVDARNQAFPRNPVSLADWQYFMQSPQWSVGTCLAAFAGDELAGSVAVYWDPAQDASTTRTGYTEEIFVLPQWRGRGLARCLVARSLAHLREHGLDRAHLEVSAINEKALGLYTGLGYQIERESWFLVKVLE